MRQNGSKGCPLTQRDDPSLLYSQAHSPVSLVHPVRSKTWQFSAYGLRQVMSPAWEWGQRWGGRESRLKLEKRRRATFVIETLDLEQTRQDVRNLIAKIRGEQDA